MFYIRYEFETAHARDDVEMIVKSYPRSFDAVQMIQTVVYKDICSIYNKLPKVKIIEDFI